MPIRYSRGAPTSRERRANRQVPQSLPLRGEGISGSQSLEGDIRDFQDRRRARGRIRAIQSRLPDYLLREDPIFKLRNDLDGSGYLGMAQTRRGQRDVVSLAPSMVASLAGLDLPGDEPQASPEALRTKAAITRAAGGRVPKATSDPVARAKKRAQQVLLHELVHVHQPESGGGRGWEREGGAELLSRKLAREMFGYKASTNHPYQPYVQRVKRAGLSLRDLLGESR